MEMAILFIIIKTRLDFTIKFQGKLSLNLHFRLLFFWKIIENFLILFSEDKKLRIFQDGLHDIHQDCDSNLLKDIISQWLTEKMSNAPKKLGKEFKFAT